MKTSGESSRPDGLIIAGAIGSVTTSLLFTYGMITDRENMPVFGREQAKPAPTNTQLRPGTEALNQFASKLFADVPTNPNFGYQSGVQSNQGHYYAESNCRSLNRNERHLAAVSFTNASATANNPGMLEHTAFSISFVDENPVNGPGQSQMSLYPYNGNWWLYAEPADDGPVSEFGSNGVDVLDSKGNKRQVIHLTDAQVVNEIVPELNNQFAEAHRDGC